MTSIPCPRCQAAAARRLDDLSTAAWVDYFRCEQCGSVWNVPKSGDTPPTAVTRPKD
jgi:hypothetical protein